MKRNFKIFIRSFYISTVIAGCLIFAFLGTAAAYENTARIGFGEYKKAVELTDGGIRIFDFEIEF